LVSMYFDLIAFTNAKNLLMEVFCFVPVE